MPESAVNIMAKWHCLKLRLKVHDGACSPSAAHGACCTASVVAAQKHCHCDQSLLVMHPTTSTGWKRGQPPCTTPHSRCLRFITGTCTHPLRPACSVTSRSETGCKPGAGEGGITCMTRTTAQETEETCP